MDETALTITDVRRIALELDGIEESTTFRAPSFKLRGRVLACPAINKSAEPDSLMVCVGFDQRDELIAAEPKIYYLTDHYADHPVVLVRLSETGSDAFQGVLEMGWRFMMTHTGTSKRRRARR